MTLSLTAALDDNGRRLDRILRKALRETALSAIHRLLRQGRVCVDGKTAGAGLRIQAGQIITVESDLPAKVTGPQPAEALPRGATTPHSGKLPEILFEGAGLLVLNKPAGLEVHGKGSLEDQVRSYLKPKIPPSLSFRPGPLHRLDKPSSGIIVYSTNLEGARFFSALIKERKIKKFYLALVQGIVENAEIWRDELIRDKSRQKTFTADLGAMMVEAGRPSDDSGPAAGKDALTRVKPLAGNNNCTLILAEIETGRTHQIRVQAASRGHPLLGDRKYGAKPFPPDGTFRSFLLHAWRLEFPTLKFSGEIPAALNRTSPPLPNQIEAPLPGYFKSKIRELLRKDIASLLP